MALTWNQLYEVGVADIDGQHKRLFDYLNRTMDLVAGSADPGELQRVLAFLGDYIQVHFQTEEAYMRRFRYPEMESHLAEHQAFKEQFRKREEELTTTKSMTMGYVRLNRLLSEWWIDHINQSDMKMGRFLASRLSMP